ncbi:MAG: flagellar biosynthesis anti-sigma factor FlgM [Deltaproteobacteria bacterium]
MRIEPKVVGAVVADSRQGKPTKPPATTTPSSTQPVSTVVTLSHAAKASASDDAEVDPINRTRLDEIRAAIKQDKYPIDLDKLASKIIEDDKLRGHS